MQMAEDLTMNHEYLPTIGLDDFRLSAMKLLVGDGSKAVVENRASLIIVFFIYIIQKRFLN